MRHKVVFFMALVLLFCGIKKATGQPLFPVLQNGQWGYVDADGNLAIAAGYDKAGNMENGIAKARKGSSLFVIFNQNRILELRGCTRLEVLKTAALYKIQKNNKWWLADTNGNLITGEGFDRIWAVPETSGRYYFANEGKMGVLDSTGAVLMRSSYANLRRLGGAFYVVYTPQRMAVLLNENGQVMDADSFWSLEMVHRDQAIFYGSTVTGKRKLFSPNTNFAVYHPQLKYELLGNDFISIIRGREIRLFDMRRMVYIDSLKGVFSTSPLPGCVMITYRNGVQRNFDRKYGILTAAYPIEIVTPGKLPVFRTYGRFGLLNEDNTVLLDPIYVQIEKINSHYFRVMDSTISNRIFDVDTKTWINNNYYESIVVGSNYLKAFGPDKTMDHIRLDENGRIKEVNTFYNVQRVIVVQRTANLELWQPADIASSWNNFVGGNRRTGWYSQNVYSGINRIFMQQFGLRGYDSVSKKMIVYLSPYYHQVNVLNVPNLTIAAVYNTRGKRVPVSNRNSALIRLTYALINDANGRRLVPYADFIDAADCENNQAANFRTAWNGRMQVISKQTRKPLFTAVYVGRENFGVRRVCVSGTLSAEAFFDEKSALQDNDYLNTLGLMTSRNIASYVIKNADWRIYISGGKLVRPAIAEGNKISFISDFFYGHAIVVLSNGKCGVIDSLGNTHIPADYDYIQFSPHIPGYFYCGTRSNKYGLVNQYGEIIMAPTYNSLVPAGDVYYGKIKDSMYLVQMDAAIQIARNARPLRFEDETGFIKTRSGYHVTRDMGETIAKCAYQGVRPFHHGYAAVSVAGFWGLIDSDGKIVIKPRYIGAKEFGYTAGIFQHRSKWIFVDLEGKKLRRPKLSEAHEEIAPGVFVYKKKNRYGMFDADGKKLASFRFSDCPLWINDQIVGAKNNKVFFFTSQGAKAGFLPAVSREKNKQFTLQRAGRLHLEMYENYHVLQFAPAQLKVFGMDTPWNSLVIPLGIRKNSELQKDYLFDAYKNDIYLVRNRNYEFVNGNNQRVIDQEFTKAEPMRNGMAICRTLNSKFGLLDKQGFWLLPPEYSDIKRMNDSIFSFRIAYEYDVYDENGQKITEEKADVLRYQEGVLTLQHENRIGYYRKGIGFIWEIQE